MPHFHRERTATQMAIALGAFAVCAALLESGGLEQWSQRLELGPLRTVAVPVALHLHRALAPLRVEKLRTKALAAIARTHWSDDPAAATEESADTATITQTETPQKTSPAPIKSEPALVPATPTMPQTAAGDPPLRTNLPAFTEAGKPLTIALAGDSMMAVGLSSTILREAPKYPSFTFIKAFKSGTGLARPEVFDWQREYPAMLAGARPDVVIVAIGANDGQGFVDHDVTYPFGSEGWKTIYQQRVTQYLHTLQAGGAHVIWLGLPPMKSDSYDEHIRLVNRIDYAIVQASPRVTWLSTAGIIGDANGAFRDFGEAGGKTVRLRQGDGIHFSDEGATLVVGPLLASLAGR